MTTSTSRTPSSAPPTQQDWRRFGRTTLLPLILLIGLLALLGQWHVDLASGYTEPRVVLDERGGFVFWDGGSDAGFYHRRIEGLDELGEPRWKEGQLVDAALADERLVALFAPASADEAWFYSLYKRATLERTWSKEVKDRELGLRHPRHLAALGERVFLFGSDRRGRLRVARLTAEGALQPLPARIEDAALLKGVEQDPADVAPPRGFASAALGERLVLLWRVEAGDRIRGSAKGEVRWTTFDGEAFGPVRTFAADLGALAAVALPGPEGPAVFVYGVPRASQEAQIARWRLDPAGERFEAAGAVDYQREGLTGAAGVVSLAAAGNSKGELLFAQIGATIRYRVREGERWGPWQDLARRPAEQMAVVYGWFGALLLLSLLLVGKGLELLRRRGPAPAAAERARAEEAEPPAATASLIERALAFGIDLGLVLALATLLSELAPQLVERAELEPKGRLALVAWFLVLLLSYFVGFEVALARTPGKLALGLEVQDEAGGRPATAALIYRNLFRVELLLPPGTLVPVLTLVLMLTTPLKQRPGDLVARTVVRRAPLPRPAPVPEPSGRSE